MSRAHAGPADAVLVDAVALAIRAPSIHNTQPWRFRIGKGQIQVFADRSRQLKIVDPGGRALLVSCGAALFQARIALQAAGWQVSTERMPDPADPDHLATLTAREQSGGSEPSQQLAAAAAARRTDRRPFSDRPLDGQTASLLTGAAAAENATLHPVRDRDDRLELIVAVGRADEIETADPAYLQEMRQWTGRETSSAEGVPVSAVPHLPKRESDVELRDFEVAAPGELPATAPEQVERAAMFVLATDGDGAADRLRAGEAVTRVLLTAVQIGLSASPYTQPLEVAGTMGLLHRILGGVGQPQMVLRVGWPQNGKLPPPTGRRELQDVVEFMH